MENMKDEIKNEEVKNPPVDEKPSSENSEGGYLGYYVFVAVSAILGFASVFYLTLYGIKIGNEKGITNIINHETQIAALVAIIAVILFMFITIIFKKFWKKVFFTEIFLYLYIGFLTTVISILVFAYFDEKLNPSGKKGDLGWIVAEILSFIVAVTFAFVCDKLLVFKSLNFKLKKIASEFGLFVGGRLATEGIAVLIMYVLINMLGNKEIVAKFVVVVVVIVLNYLLSKFIIFKKVPKDKEKVEDGSVNEKTI